MVHIITFDLDLISSAGIDMNTWKKEVEMFEVTLGNFDVSHTHNKFYLDVVKFSIENDNFDWVNKNKSFVCYDGSKEAIEFMHTIDNNDSYNYDNEIDLQVLNNNFSKLTLQELKDLGYIFDQPKYQEEYMIMEMDIENKLKKAQFGKYDKKIICFSHPFFKSIVDNNKKDSTKWIFYFVKIMVAGNKVIAFFIDFGDGTKKYYDFSQIPPPPERQMIPPNLDSNARNTNPGNEWHVINGGNALSILKGLQSNRVF